MQNVKEISVLIIFLARTNIAVGKKSRQSSTYKDSTSLFGPQHANDGKTYALADVFSHTELNTKSCWWAVNLGPKYIIDSISIHNRHVVVIFFGSLVMLYSVTLI